MPRTKQPINPNETEAQRFVRLVNHRVNLVLTGLKAISALRGPNYKSTPEQHKKIKEALIAAVERSIKALESGEASQEFKL